MLNRSFIQLHFFLFFFIQLFPSSNLYSTYLHAAGYKEKAVDVVFTWVDGADEKWIEERNQWAEIEGKEKISIDSLGAHRFRNSDELRYALRSVYQYAPFIRHIFLATSGQVPSWFRPHPMVTIVSHSDFFRDPTALPTFNSHAIESNIHAIKGLSEHYIYMNDDVFLGRPTKFEDFFSDKGTKINLFFSKNREMRRGVITPLDSGYIAAMKNVSNFLDSRFGIKKRFVHGHTPYPQIKSAVYQIESELQEFFAANSHHRFRSVEDYAMTNGLIPYMCLYQGLAKKRSVEAITVGFGKDYKHDCEKIQQIMSGKYTFFCLNDVSAEPDPRSRRLVSELLHLYFPNPAPWEKEEELIEKGLFKSAKKIVKQKIVSHKKRVASLKKAAKILKKAAE